MMFDNLDHLKGAISVRIHKMFLNLISKPDVSQIDEYLYFGGVTKIKLLSDYQINSVLDLRSEDHDNEEHIKKYSINYLRIKINDRDIPDHKDALIAIKWVNERIENKQKVFIHCNLGRGRAPLITCLYQISRGINHEDAIRNVKNIRKYTYLNKKQLQYISNFQKIKINFYKNDEVDY